MASLTTVEAELVVRRVLPHVWPSWLGSLAIRRQALAANMNPWIGVDLDGTLAEYHGWQGPEHIGAPIPAMVERIKRWLGAGKDVRIFTARVGGDPLEAFHQRHIIQVWCAEHVGCALPVTATKDYGMVELWDDRAVQVIANTGESLAECCYSSAYTIHEHCVPEGMYVYGELLRRLHESALLAEGIMQVAKRGHA